MKRKKPSAVTLEYRKKRKLLMQRVRRMRERGFEIPDEVIPKIPKKITLGSVRRLERLTTQEIAKKSTYYDVETGEVVEGRKALAHRRRAAAEKAAVTRRRNARSAKARELEEEEGEEPSYSTPSATTKTVSARKEETNAPRFADVVIDNWYKQMSPYAGKGMYSVLVQWMDSIIQEHGKEDVAEMLQKGAAAGYIITPKVTYSDAACMDYISGIIDYLPEAGELTKEDIMYQVNEYVNFNGEEMGEILG